MNQKDKPSSEKLSYRITETGDSILANYDEKGILISEMTIKNNRMNGPSWNYYENGNIQNEITYKDGEKNGRATWNYENGKLFRETHYSMGKIDGIQKKYYKDGRIMAEIPYKDGGVVAGTVEYNDEGKKKRIAELKIEEIDKVAFDRSYYLRVSLSKKQADTKFFRIVESVRGNPVKLPLQMKDNYAEIKWLVPEGTFIMEKVHIVAEFTTLLSNPVVLEKTLNVAVENR